MTQPEIATLLKQAVSEHQTGNIEQAGTLYREILRIDPDHPDALHMLGVLRFQLKDYTAGCDLIRRAISLCPDIPAYHFNLANGLYSAGIPKEAVTACKKAIALNPSYSEAHHVLGLSLGMLRDYDNAIAHYKKAIRLMPEFSAAHASLAKAFNNAARLDEAIEYFSHAVIEYPRNAGLHFHLANALKDRGRTDEALENYRKSLELNPSEARTYNNMGNLLHDNQRLSEAISCYQKALLHTPDNAYIYNNLGGALEDMGRLDEAIHHFQQSLKLKPDLALAHSNLLFCMNNIEQADKSRLYEKHRQWTEQHAQPVTGEMPLHTNDPSPDRTIKIGYVSPDFRTHSVTYFFEPILQHHNRSDFEVFCYSSVSNPDIVTHRLKDLSDHWRDISKMNDREAADLIIRDRIDILVDLAGHTAGNMMCLFSRKPAPIQVTYLGYPNTTGLPTMDYRITDAIADPEGLTEPYHTEKLIRLKKTFLCYRPPEDTPQITDSRDRAGQRVTFGSFNNRAKITREVIKLWSEILHAVPGSKMILKAKFLSDPGSRDYLISLFNDNGIPKDRLELFGYLPSKDAHLELYRRIDIALDTFPYNGTTTTCEALWMGVPAIVMQGDSHISRVGMSILSAVGLKDLIAINPEDYANKSVSLAQDPGFLNSLRKDLRDMMRSSPLMDEKAFTMELETEYKKMFTTWCEDVKRHVPAGNAAAPYHKTTMNLSGLPKQDIEAMIIRGEELFNQGMLESAMNMFLKVIAAEPENTDALNNLGVLYWHTGDRNAAMHYLKKTLDIDPDNTDALFNLKNMTEEAS